MSRSSAESTVRPAPHLVRSLYIHHGGMESIGGYELVRRLGSGPRAEVFLGWSRSGNAPSSDATAAIKVFRPATTRADIEHEIDALTRTKSEHLVRLVDIATAPDGKPALVLSLLATRKLSELIIVTHRLSAGEVVTATVPIVEAVAELHRAGVGHGSVRLGNISFDERGAPVLMGFGRARILGHHGQKTGDGVSATVPAVDDRAADLADLAVVVRCVCASTEADTTDILDHLDRLPTAGDCSDWCDQLIDALHDLGPGESLRLENSGREQEIGTAASERTIATERSMIGERRSALLEVRSQRTPAWMAAVGLPEMFAELARSPMPATLKRITQALKAVRRPFWFAAGGVAAVLLASMILIPQNVPAAARPDHGEATAASDEDKRSPAAPYPSTSAIDPPAPLPSDSADSPIRIIEGDEPVAALQSLLTARARCFEARSVLCLDSVDQTSSAAWDLDSSFITRHEAGGEIQPALLDATSIALSDRLGDSAILTATDSDTGLVVTVLTIKDGSGWRIRDIITP